MDEIRLGVEWFPQGSRRTGNPVTCPLDGHFELIAPPGAGKGACLEIPNLCLGLQNVSVLSIDPSGQNAAVCAEARRRMGHDVLCLNPFGMHTGIYPDLTSAGFNPLAGITSRDERRFYEDCAAVAEALIMIEGKDPHWSTSARGLITGLIMWEVLKAEHYEHRAPLLEEVRRMLCEPIQKDDNGIVTAGLPYHAGDAIGGGHPLIADLCGRYKESSREIDSIVSTARSQCEWLLSVPMREDLKKNGIDWRRLAERRTTIFVILPSQYLEAQLGRVWLRLVTMSALRALFATEGRRTVDKIVFMLSEFAALGKLKAAEAARSQGRKFGIRLWPVLQDIHQLNSEDMYGRNGADSFAGQCKAVFAFAPGDFPSAEWMSQRGGEHDVPMESASENTAQPGVHRSYQLHRERQWKPEDILGLPEHHGLVWFQGQAAPTAVYAPPYWKIPECARVARPDPYHGARSSPRDDPADSSARPDPPSSKALWAELREGLERGRGDR